MKINTHLHQPFLSISVKITKDKKLKNKKTFLEGFIKNLNLNRSAMLMHTLNI